MAPLVQFVDGPSASPTVLMDITPNQSPVEIGEGISFPPPPIDRVIADTLMQDGANIPASAYGMREVHLPVIVPTTTTADARRTAMQTLARILNQQSFFLRVRPDTGTTDYFLRCYRSSADQIDALLQKQWGQASIDLLADPFALGVEQVAYSNVLTTEKPSGASNAVFDFNSVIGDVEAPLFIKTGPGQQFGPPPATDAAAVCQAFGTILAVRRRGTPSNIQHWTYPDATASAAGGISAGVDALTTVADAANAWNGTGYFTTPFTTTPTALTARYRIIGPMPTGASLSAEDKYGLYRVIIRFRNTVGGTTYQFALGDANFNRITDPTVPITLAAANYFLADLGTVQIGPSPETWRRGATTASDAGNPNKAAGSTAVHDLTLLIARTAGSGLIGIDAVMFFPADDLFMQGFAGLPFSGTGVTTLGTDRWEVDSLAQQIRVVNNASNYVKNAEGGPQANYISRGGFPMVTPGKNNRLYTFQIGGWQSSPGVTVSYYPRYLWIV